ncbi:MAG: type I DNA topoisomerase [Kiritimatiellae bacterium]|nr:type I DNA topoisomerase [Kiritimatiellia bacterium]
MGKKLVVVESPAKAKTINKILGKDFIVESSMGHVRDLPVRSLGVDVEANFNPKYVLIKGRRKVVDKLKKAAKSCDAIYLAPDPDREGEAIAWHLAAILGQANKDAELLRVQYNEITPTAVKRAFSEPTAIDQHRVDAQQARRVLDRIVGYMVSPMLWRRIRRGLSAGRVQSVALRLLCEREKEVQAFVPEAYWIHGALARKLITPLDPFKIKLVRVDGKKADVNSEQDSQAILDDLKGRSLKVQGIATKQITKRPPPPYITSSLQQAGSSFCGYSPKRTMALAQMLYEGVDLGQGPEGLITYMRTDSVHLADDAVQACRSFIANKFGNEFCPEKPNRYRSRSGAQEAHEAIRPTNVQHTPESLRGKLDPAAQKLYGLIWSRFVACQMAPAKLQQRTVTIEAVKPSDEAREFLFNGSTTDIVFPGYMKATGADRKKAEGDEQDRVPELSENEPLVCVEWLAERKETQPPPRFSETSLVGALERNGVGRPSTYAQTVSTLYDRQYAQREKRTMIPTDLGMRVSDLLTETLGDLFNVSFTASMEEKLDRVEKGEEEWTGMLGEFYEQFSQWLEKTKAPPADNEDVEKVLALFTEVTEWAPEVQRGKRKYSDEKFVASVQKRKEDKGNVSVRQLEALVRIACKYDGQLPEVEKRMTEMGLGSMVERVRDSRPAEEMLRKLEVAESLDSDESTAKFVGSLRQQTDMGRALSDAQVKVLDSILLGAADQIPDAKAIFEELDLSEDDIPDDKESGAILEAMSVVSEWNPPTQRGKRTYDDKAFIESLRGYYGRKKFLSERQRGALKRICGRYADQIPNFAELAETYGIKVKAAGKKEPAESREQSAVSSEQ